eukprot:CAMPEP_0204068082 /NCGR_PEP_ID=MMETSP0360-20130528/154683_1 /ASSEMBLY_ACC=CAM_ASM_000342 /TAXON_ID=268821 /ORGANISM="Scrippsiella Hangoei, Strain SHTV-5" /LENGTH=267 /DNA_ID=CAMNT_0051016195 /DNA_START=222 /DNA_END=1022 /DNA_ORIENTATION=+
MELLKQAPRVVREQLGNQARVGPGLRLFLSLLAPPAHLPRGLCYAVLEDVAENVQRVCRPLHPHLSRIRGRVAVQARAPFCLNRLPSYAQGPNQALEATVPIERLRHAASTVTRPKLSLADEEHCGMVSARDRDEDLGAEHRAHLLVEAQLGEVHNVGIQLPCELFVSLPLPALHVLGGVPALPREKHEAPGLPADLGHGGPDAVAGPEEHVGHGKVRVEAPFSPEQTLILEVVGARVEIDQHLLEADHVADLHVFDRHAACDASHE